MSVSGFKGFNKDLKCRGFQYEVGKEYEEQEAIACNKGFHFCEYPLDVFGYYPPSSSRFCEVVGDGQFDRDTRDSKVACTKIHIGAEIGIRGLIDAAVKFVFDIADWSKKENHTTGDQGAASATGYQGAASATGNQGAASATGEESVAMSVGYEGKAKGALGCWLVLSEWEQDDKYDWHRKDVQGAKVDGEIIKADTFYQLIDGNFVESEEDDE